MGYIPSDNLFNLPATRFSDISGAEMFCGSLSSSGGSYHTQYKLRSFSYSGVVKMTASNDGAPTAGSQSTYILAASTSRGMVTFCYDVWSDILNNYTSTGGGSGNFTLGESYTYNNKTVYYYAVSSLRFKDSNNTIFGVVPGGSAALPVTSNRGQYAWLMVYGDYDGFNVTYDLMGCVGESGNPAVIRPDAVITNAHFSPDAGYSFVYNSVYVDGEYVPADCEITYNYTVE